LHRTLQSVTQYGRFERGLRSTARSPQADRRDKTPAFGLRRVTASRRIARSEVPIIMALVATRLARAISIFLMLGLAAPLAAAQPDAGARLALVIGNGTYGASDKPSSVPIKNAQSLADELRRAGFGVELHENLDRGAITRAAHDFSKKITRGDTVLFFFSGYGIQAKGSTWLVPVDADIWTEQDVAVRSVSLGEITRAFEDAGAGTLIVILDASRRNPFERRFRTLSMGLGPIALPKSSLLISAAGEGEVADDGDGETSLFVGELLKEMRAPDLTVQEIFGRTRVGITRATNGAQRPFVLSSVAEDIPFGERKAASAHGKPVSAAPTESLPSGARGPGQIFRDCDRCPDLVVVGPGEFTMGSDAFETERPAHRALIDKPFAIGRSEVTVAQWDACVADGGCPERPSDQQRGQPELPAGALSWHDARAYAEWLTRLTGHTYRLPSETEWEYAARGGTASAFWWGDDPRAGSANCRGCSNDGGGRPLPTGSTRPNPFGLLDSAGNLAEWVADCWTESYRAAPRDPASCKQRIVRGGSFDAGPRFARSSSRFPQDPDLRYYANGVRMLRELP
jgi:formylglycine-generating enzyme required for sulfatase activity